MSPFVFRPGLVSSIGTAYRPITTIAKQFIKAGMLIEDKLAFSGTTVRAEIRLSLGLWTFCPEAYGEIVGAYGWERTRDAIGSTAVEK